MLHLQERQEKEKREEDSDPPTISIVLNGRNRMLLEEEEEGREEGDEDGGELTILQTINIFLSSDPQHTKLRIQSKRSLNIYELQGTCSHCPPIIPFPFPSMVEVLKQVYLQCYDNFKSSSLTN
jgi:hypothetical protein